MQIMYKMFLFCLHEGVTKNILICGLSYILTNTFLFHFTQKASLVYKADKSMFKYGLTVCSVSLSNHNFSNDY